MRRDRAWHGGGSRTTTRALRAELAEAGSFVTHRRREQDSNPRSPREGNYAHETASFDRYDVSLTSSPRSPALQTGNYLDDAFGNPQ